jgi:nucleotide-binding universal stress UspA family protein
MTAVPATGGKAGYNAAADYVGRRILVVGIDGSAPSWDAFAWAAGEALRVNGRIVAVFVTPLIEPGEAFAPLAYAAAAGARGQMAEELAAEVAKCADAVGVEVIFIRGMGDVARVLAEVARSEHADLMVVGRSAKTMHRLAGSVSRRLVLNRDSPATVVVP